MLVVVLESIDIPPPDSKIRAELEFKIPSTHTEVESTEAAKERFPLPSVVRT